MQSKKGIYVIGALLSIVLITFLVLFLVHENTLENGILFKVSFEYENANSITYQFYNQSGKIEKVETDGETSYSYMLPKTEYNTVRLLRQLLKGLKPSKTPWQEEGINIYNGQNKRYYLLPFDHPVAKELSNLIIDGYIHHEMDRFNNTQDSQEIYLYQTTSGKLEWTNDGSQKRIIDTYQCGVENCYYYKIDQENNISILWDKVNYIYDYKTKYKEVINTSEELQDVEILRYNNQIKGLILENKESQRAFYDYEHKEVTTEFKNQNWTLINDAYLLNTQTDEPNVWYVWNYKTKEVKQTLSLTNMQNEKYTMLELKNSKATYYLLEKESANQKSYQVYNVDFEKLLEDNWYQEVKIEENGDLSTISLEDQQETRFNMYGEEIKNDEA